MTIVDKTRTSTTIPKESVYQDYPLFVAVNGVSNNKKRKTTPHFVPNLSQITYKKRKRLTHFVPNLNQITYKVGKTTS
ncbi:hypothetical protein HMPREF1583_01426 [Gardnerella vaginalis JCP8151B]|nr:hypothetical protein HMPREF1583_01426 [Gardnerella vaginalis JCP8151B]